MSRVNDELGFVDHSIRLVQPTHRAQIFSVSLDDIPHRSLVAAVQLFDEHDREVPPGEGVAYSSVLRSHYYYTPNGMSGDWLHLGDIDAKVPFSLVRVIYHSWGQGQLRRVEDLILETIIATDLRSQGRSPASNSIGSYFSFGRTTEQ